MFWCETVKERRSSVKNGRLEENEKGRGLIVSKISR
jgi:hypothetical protein